MIAAGLARFLTIFAVVNLRGCLKRIGMVRMPPLTLNQLCLVQKECSTKVKSLTTVNSVLYYIPWALNIADCFCARLKFCYADAVRISLQHFGRKCFGR